MGPQTAPSGEPVLGRRGAALIALLLMFSGAASLVLQVTWQRALALHSGIDLASTTTVVAAFLGGLGLGNLLGGRIADRCRPTQALAVFAGTELVVVVCAAFGTQALYAAGRGLAPQLASITVSVAFAGVALLVPTTAMGCSIPLATRAVVGVASDAGPLAGRLLAANTFGAAFGAALAGWYLVGSHGLVGAGRWAAAAGLIVVVTLAAIVVTRRRGVGAGAPTGEAPAPDPVDLAGSHHPLRWPWLVVYGGTGAVAVGFELVMFRLVDGIMRSNTYTFAHVLAMYLALLAAGNVAGSVLVRRVADPRRWFLWSQALVGLTAAAGLVVLVDLLPEGRIDAWFDGEGFADGFPTSWGDRGLFGVFLPLVVMAAPVVLMGVGFPLVSRIVTHDAAEAGRRTGLLLCCNLVGNVGGAIITGFVLLDRVGVGGSYLVLLVAWAAAGFVGAAMAPRPRMRTAQVAAVAVTVVASAIAMPTNVEIWAFLHGVERDGIVVAEDRSCAAALKLFGNTGAQLTLNAARQNGYPFDDFHVLIGLVPALLLPEGSSGLAVGYGAGSTSYGMLASERTERVTSVDVCGGTFTLTAELARRGERELRRLLDDPSHVRVVGDGRSHMLSSDRRDDIVVTDHSRTVSPGAGNLFSREYFEIVREHLGRDGVTAGWIPTYRTQNAVTTTFPYAVSVTVESYNGSRFFLASRSPIEIDIDELVRRYDRIAAAFDEPQRSSLRDFLATMNPECLTDGSVAREPRPSAENRDLHPRDEYFLSNGVAPAEDAVVTC